MARDRLKRLSKTELLELLVIQSKRVEELEKKVEKLTARLEDRTIVVDNAGNLATACLELNHIFETAQWTANYYLENVAKLCERRLAEAGIETADEAVDPEAGKKDDIVSGTETGHETDTGSVTGEGDGGDGAH